MNSSKLRVRFTGDCFKQEKVTFNPKNVVNVVILEMLSRSLNVDFTLKDYLFGSVMLNENTDPDKYSYSGYGIGFVSCSVFSYPGLAWGKDVVIFGLEISSSVHIDNN